MGKTQKIEVMEKSIAVLARGEEDYICLTDMVRGEDSDRHIYNWLRNRNTVEFLGIWETIHNTDFKPIEFDRFKHEAGLNSFNLSPKRWVEATNAIGLLSRSGKQGGTYAHRDIAFEFAAWINPAFKLYLIKEYQRLKQIETNQYNLEWNVKRILSKANYHIHTDAVRKCVLPVSSLPKSRAGIAYADEADVLNLAVFGCTAKEWRDANRGRAETGENIRDIASINELAVLSNLESMNAEMMTEGIAKNSRFQKLCAAAKRQLAILDGKDFIKSLKKESNTVYLHKKMQ
jgi:KilA-N domain